MKLQERRSTFLEVGRRWLLCVVAWLMGLTHFLDECLQCVFVLIASSIPIGNWKEELQKYINPDQLPQAYGGTRCEPDPYCSNYVNLSLSLSHSLMLFCYR